MNPDLQRLQPYPFERLAKLLAGIAPPADKPLIRLSIGEPKHPAPDFVLHTLEQYAAEYAIYPTTKGLDALRECIARWLCQRFALSRIDPQSEILPVNGTREALFSFIQASITRHAGSVISPNPFYQIYEGAAVMAGATPLFLSCAERNGYLPDFDAVPASTWQQCQALFLCTPGNPTGAVIPLEQLKKLIALADEFDFVICSDECYSEIYTDTAPPGLLQACAELGRHDYARCVVFHSLSKRSNVPGLRSGFVAGDAQLMKPYLQYRTYHGCAMPLPVQYASIAAWNDEQHVETNRVLYREKFAAVLGLLGDTSLRVQQTDASFYLWPRTPMDDETFTQRLYAEQGVLVLPGSYLSRSIADPNSGIPENPGAGHIRMALVASLDECIDAAERIRTFCKNL